MKSFFLKPKSVFFPLWFDLVCAAAQRGEQAQHVTCKCRSQLSSLVLNSSLNNWMRRCIHCCDNKEEPRLQTHPSVHLMCWSCQSDDMRTNQSAHCVINHPCSLPALQLVSVQEEEEDGGGGPCHLHILPPRTPHPLPSFPRVTPGCLSKKGVAALVTRTPASPANKGCSVWAAARPAALAPEHNCCCSAKAPRQSPAPHLNIHSSALQSSAFSNNIHAFF